MADEAALACGCTPLVAWLQLPLAAAHSALGVAQAVPTPEQSPSAQAATHLSAWRWAAPLGESLLLLGAAQVYALSGGDEGAARRAARQHVLMVLIVALTFIQFRFIERRVHYT